MRRFLGFSVLTLALSLGAACGKKKGETSPPADDTADKAPAKADEGKAAPSKTGGDGAQPPPPTAMPDEGSGAGEPSQGESPKNKTRGGKGGGGPGGSAPGAAPGDDEKHGMEEEDE